ncbi:MAG: class I SAM-dependent methyltransferase [Desulfobacterales bacterium]|nr:class I SAM-dependent methyltransferase [Desulfobacterales bacterium]
MMKPIIESLSGHTNEYIRCLAGAHPLRAPLICAMLDSLSLGGKGLDVGCGIGLPALEMARKGLDVAGLDSDAQFIEIAEGIAGELNLKNSPVFVQGHAERLEFENNFFDWVWSMDCVNYDKDLNDPPLSEMKRVAKPGGRLILSAWSSQMLLPGYPELEARLNISPEGLAPFEAGMAPLRHFMATAGVLKRMGLKNIRCKTFLRDIALPLSREEIRAMKDLFYMRWSHSPSGLNPDEKSLYTSLTDPESGRFILSDSGFYGFFTYTMFTGEVP